MLKLAPSLFLAAMIMLPLPAGAQPPAPPAKPQPTTQPATPPAGKPAPRATAIATTPEFHEGTEARHKRFNEISKEGTAQLVFLGDSITEGWETGGKEIWAKRYAPRNAANFGVSGDRTEHVLWRLDHGNFDGLHPKLIVLMIGTNNTGHRQDPAPETGAGVKAIVNKLRAKCPEAKILLLAIFPRGENADDKLRKINDDVNKLLERLADGKTVIYKDVGAGYLDAKGNMKKDLMPDLLHPNTKGYEVWADAIEADIVKLMGEK